MSILFRFMPAAAAALLLLTSCAQLSVTGPCEVQSDSSITLDIAWGVGSGVSAAVAPQLASTAMENVVAKVNGAGGGRPFQLRAEAAGETVWLMMEVPSTWSETVVSATADGAPATLVGLDDAPYCGEMLGTARSGYVRRFYHLTPAAPLTSDSVGTFQVTYATATIADGVYHPAVMLAVEPDVETQCMPQGAFHRVTAGTLKFVNFDLSSNFNADTVVNGTDVEQDPLLLVSDGEGTARLAFATEGFTGDITGLPNDGLLTPERFATQAVGMELIDMPECLPAIQLGWSEDSDGNNSWVQQAEDDALVVDVPDAHYAELLLYVTPGISELASPQDLFRAMRVTMTYDDGPVTEVATLVPLLGLPVVFPPLAPDAPDLVPSFTMGLGLMTDTDGSGASGSPMPLGIAAMLVTPDSSRRLVSVTITPFVPDTSEVGLPVSAKSPQSQAALEPVKLAVFGVAGMQLVPDLVVDKSLVTPAPYVIGSEVTYQVAVTNSGNAPATAVTVTDTIEPQLAFVTVNPSVGTCGEAGGVVTCDFGDLAPGASATIAIVANLVAVGPFSNTAAASMDGEEDDTSNNQDTVAAVALGIPNLAVGKTVETPTPHLIGGEVTYRLTVTNDGSADSTAVTLTDPLPAELAFVSATPSAGTCGEAAGTVTCSLGTLAAGASATVDIIATINSAGSITNTGTASMDGGEADVSDNSASVTIAAEGIANLAFAKTVATPAPYVLGDQVTYRLTVTNDGTADSGAVTVTDVLPAGLAFVSASPSAGTCNEAGGTVTCSLGPLATGASATVDLVATLESVGSITNTGTASMDGEADVSDNSASVTIAADGIANLAFAKTVETPAPYVLGDQVTYRLTVTNDGTADSGAVTVTDVLPAGLAFVSASPSAGTCNEAGGTVTCSLGVLIAGGSATVDLAATLESVGSITNTGAASMDGEADVSDNSASVTIAADGIANLAFAKTVETPAPHIVGTQVTYRLTVTNDGTAGSAAVTVTDGLPIGLGYVSATPSTGTCSEAGGTVTCSLGVIAAGASETVDIVATIMGVGEITNTASATMAGAEADVSDNSASVTFTAAAAAVAGVPTLSEWAMLLMVSMLGLIAVARMRA